MKKLVGLLAVLLIASAPALAQKKGEGGAPRGAGLMKAAPRVRLAAVTFLRMAPPPHPPMERRQRAAGVGSQVTRIPPIATRPGIPKRPTSMRETTSGSGTTPAGTIPTTTSIIPGNMDDLAAKPAADMFTGLKAGTGSVFGLAVSTLMSPRTTMITAATGSGAPTIS